MTTQWPDDERVPDHFKKRLRIGVGGKRFVVEAGHDGWFDRPVLSKDKRKVVVLRYRDEGKYGFSCESIVRITQNGVENPITSCAIPNAGRITDIHDISDDGNRLLVTLHYVIKKTKTCTNWNTRPVVLHLDEGIIKEVEF